MGDENKNTESKKNGTSWNFWLQRLEKAAEASDREKQDAKYEMLLTRLVRDLPHDQQQEELSRLKVRHENDERTRRLETERETRTMQTDQMQQKINVGKNT